MTVPSPSSSMGKNTSRSTIASGLDAANRSRNRSDVAVSRSSRSAISSPSTSYAGERSQRSRVRPGSASTSPSRRQTAHRAVHGEPGVLQQHREPLGGAGLAERRLGIVVQPVAELQKPVLVLVETGGDTVAQRRVGCGHGDPPLEAGRPKWKLFVS
jgi:hypothetical protein